MYTDCVSTLLLEIKIISKFQELDNIDNNLSFNFHKTYTAFMKNCKSYKVFCDYYPFSTGIQLLGFSYILTV